MGYAAVVVNYLKNAHCCSLADSLAQQCLKPDLLVIVDNSGQLNADYFANDLPFKLIIVTPGYNTGYSVGANLGVSLAISLCPEGLILLLSPDILFPNADTVDKLYFYSINGMSPAHQACKVIGTLIRFNGFMTIR